MVDLSLLPSASVNDGIKKDFSYTYIDTVAVKVLSLGKGSMLVK